MTIIIAYVHVHCEAESKDLCAGLTQPYHRIGYSLWQIEYVRRGGEMYNFDRCVEMV